MSGKDKIVRIIHGAIQKETEAFNYYHRASLNAGTIETESLLIQLAEEERKHRIFLLQELERLEALMDQDYSGNSMDYDAVRFTLPEKVEFKKMRTIPQIELETVCLPVELFGGDFIDSFVIEKNVGPKSLGLLLCDVMGHGLNATRLKAETKKAIGNIRETWVRGRLSHLIDISRPKQLMKELNKKLIQDCIMFNQFITAFYAVLDPAKGVLRYTSAGQEPPIFINESGDYRHLNNTQLLIGAERNVVYQEAEVPIKPGDILVLYSDGITEAMNRRHDMFGRERIQTNVQEHRHQSAKDIMYSILMELRTFLDSEPITDEMMLSIIKIKK